MTNRTAYRRFYLAAEQWRQYAEKRRDDFRDMHSSGRWRRYYAEDRFLDLVRDIARSCERWDKISETMRFPGETFDHFSDSEPRSA